MSEPAEQITKLPDLGIHDGIPEDVYHASPGISKHGLDLIEQSGAHYKAGFVEETKALIYGGAFHCLVLEPHLFESKYIVNNKHKTFQSNKAKAWRDEQHEQGLRVISQADFDHMRRMHDVIREHAYASILLDPTQGRAEQSAYWIDDNKQIWGDQDPTYRLCRCRPDFINEAHRLVIDLKTAVCAGASKFAKVCANHRYHVQDVFYTDGLRQCGKRVDAFVFVAIEKEPPYAIGIYKLSARARELGRRQYQRDMQKYNEFMTKKEWPSYPGEIRELDLPKYAEYVDYY